MIFRPLAHVAIRDPQHRATIAAALRREGWSVLQSATGFHLLQDLSPVILGEATAPLPSLIVIDAISPGCSGITIARGLREIGHEVPIVLVADDRDRCRLAEVPAGVVVVDAAGAPASSVALARRLSGGLETAREVRPGSAGTTRASEVLERAAPLERAPGSAAASFGRPPYRRDHA
jgi:DNA-binding response OmpR family regulator